MLGFIGYNSNPSKLQSAIRQIHYHAISEIKITGLNIQPLALYDVLNGKDTEDYVARVEPSDKGGKKMAQAFSNFI